MPIDACLNQALVEGSFRARLLFNLDWSMDISDQSSGGHPVPQNLGHEASDLSNVEICQTGRDAFLTPHIPQTPVCNVRWRCYR